MKNALFILLVGAFVLSACATPVTETPATPLPVDPAGSTMPALTDPAQPIVVKAGEVFMIIVESNPSTGYHWEVIDLVDDSPFELVSREFTGSEPVLPGSGGVEVWTLKALAPGDVLLILGNYPPGEGTTPEQELRFTITVQ